MNEDFEEHLVRFRNWPLPVRVVYSRPRTFIAIAIGIAVFLLLPDSRRLVTRLVISWDAFAALYLGLAYSMMLRCGIAYIRRSAVLQDDGRFVMLLLTALGAFASLAAIVFELGASKGNPAGLILAIATISHQAAHIGGYDNAGWDLISNCVGALIAAVIIRRSGLASPAVG